MPRVRGLDVAVSMHNREVTIELADEDGRPQRLVFSEKLFRYLMSEGNTVLTYWDVKPEPWADAR